MAPKIYAHVLFYGITLGVATGGAFLISTVFGKSEEEKIKELEYKYADKLVNREHKRKEMQVFFDNFKYKNNPELDSKLDAVMKAGKSDVKNGLNNKTS